MARSAVGLDQLGRQVQLAGWTTPNINRLRTKREDNGKNDRIVSGDSIQHIFVKHFAADALKGHWRDADWLLCTDGKWRPVEAGTFPLAYGTPARLGRLRGYGDAINAEVAKAFIEAYMSVEVAAGG